MPKLELEIQEPLVRRAEAWAAKKGISLQTAVEEYFATLPGEELPLPKSPWLRQLVNAKLAHRQAPSDTEAEDDYAAYLATKYQ